MKLSTSLLILLLSSPILAHRTQRKNPKQSKKYKSHNSFQVGTFPEKESVSESSIGKSSKDIQDGPKIKMDTFIQSVENGMSEDEASELVYCPYHDDISPIISPQNS